MHSHFLAWLSLFTRCRRCCIYNSIPNNFAILPFLLSDSLVILWENREDLVAGFTPWFLTCILTWDQRIWRCAWLSKICFCLFSHFPSEEENRKVIKQQKKMLNQKPTPRNCISGVKFFKCFCYNYAQRLETTYSGR